MGGRPQAASLVQGLRPRNAPLWLPTVLVLPHRRGMPPVPPTYLAVDIRIRNQ